MTTDQRKALGSDTLRWLIGMALAAVVAYFTAINTLSNEITAVKEREESHFGEVQRSLQDIKTELRWLREQRQREAVTP